ncbi:hypothetical protein [Algibacter sp. 2305UL17-15]|uniref:hypothetical protein n=1 Tax=Algibacter sp. 2305UL17-15 TaxID=3231268 RepID=UPI00345A3C45
MIKLDNLTFLITLFAFLIVTSCHRGPEKSIVQYRTNPSKLECINFILSQDDSLGRIRNHACKSISLSNTIDQYVASINNLDFKNCPKDFFHAFENHMNAWTGMKQVTDNFPDLRGEMHDLFDTIAKSKYKQTFDPLLKDIWDTWELVEAAVNDSKKFKIAHTIDEPDLIPEGIAHNPKDNSFYIGSTWKRKILKIDSVGNVSNFVHSGQDGLLGVIGMKVDAKRQTLWVCTSSSGRGMPVKGLTDPVHNKSGIFKYNLNTKELTQQFWLETDAESFFFNDITVSSKGQVFATEMRTRTIYTIVPNEDTLRPFATLPEEYRANGIDIDEQDSNLYLALYAKPNAFGKLNIETQELKIISIPNDEKVGADGLYFYNNSLIAVQPFTDNRVVCQYVLNNKLDSVKQIIVLVPDDKILNQPTTGVISNNKFYFLANSQLQSFSQLWKKNNGEFDINDLQPVKILKLELIDN